MKHAARFCLITSTLLLLNFTATSTLAQTLSGSVSDALSLKPLPGANVILSPGGSGTTTDSAGRYAFDELEPGHYQMQVSFVGYETKIIDDIWVRTGKPAVEEITLNRQYTELQEAVVRDQQNPLELGRLSITEEQVNRFAATYYDPARLITNSPDVAVTNDINNRVSVRGISPNYNVWRLHGVEVVNPNHLSNAGTFTDEAIATGGSVNIISTQMLGKSDFLYDAYAPQFGNSLGGLFDMNLRKGNSRKRHYVLQASLIGIDLASEGPFSKNSRATYAVNYRYSFTGLLTNMGVDFGGESIGFQDLSFNVNLPFENGSELNVFALGGLNFNRFDAMSLEESEEQKDRSDIYFDGKMGGAGLSYQHSFGKGSARHSLAISSSQNIREQNFYDSTQNLLNQQNTDRLNELISWHSQVTAPLNKGSLTYGIMGNYYRYAGSSENTNFSIQQYLLNPHLNLQYQLAPRLQADVGLNYLLEESGDQAFDPRLGFTYFLNNAFELYLRGGLYSQLLNPYNYFFVFASNGGDYLVTDRDLYIQQSQRLSLGVRKNWQNWDLGVEAFHYRLPDVRVWDGTADLESDAQTTGVSLVANKNYSNNWYLNGGISLYNSTWGRDESIDNRYNTRYNLNINGGREWSKAKKEKLRIFSVNARLMYQGGLNDPFYDQDDLLQPAPPTMVVTNNADFFRLDFRVQWTWNKSGRSTSLAIDLQNLTNYENEAYTYLDSFTGQVETQFQLGLIPILTYRVEF